MNDQEFHESHITEDLGGVHQYNDLHWLIRFKIYDHNEQGVDHFPRVEDMITNVMSMEDIKSKAHNGHTFTGCVYVPNVAFGEWHSMIGLAIRWSEFPSMHHIVYDAVLIEDVKDMYSYQPMTDKNFDLIRAYIVGETDSFVAWFPTREDLKLIKKYI